MNQKKSPEAEPIIRVEGLKKSFGDRTILEQINLEVHRGEILVVMGGLRERKEHPAPSPDWSSHAG